MFILLFFSFKRDLSYKKCNVNFVDKNFKYCVRNLLMVEVYIRIRKILVLFVKKIKEYKMSSVSI